MFYLQLASSRILIENRLKLLEIFGGISILKDGKLRYLNNKSNFGILSIASVRLNQISVRLNQNTMKKVYIYGMIKKSKYRFPKI